MIFNPAQLTLQRDEATGRYVMLYNASLHKESNCLRKVWFRMLRGLGSGTKDFKMEYGTAFHKALELYYGGEKDVAVISKVAFQHYANPEIYIPDNDFRSVAHLVNCIMQYVAFWSGECDQLKPIVADGKAQLERPFSLPLLRTELVDVLAVGTIDMIATMYGQRIIVDHKTTSMSQIESYLNSYVMSPQLMMYKMNHDLLFPDNPLDGCVINGIFLSKSNKNTFRRSQVFPFSDNQIANFRMQLVAKVTDIVVAFERAIKTGRVEHFMQNFSCCEEKFGMCSYLPVCSTQNDEDVESIIATNYTAKTYNPLKFRD